MAASRCQLCWPSPGRAWSVGPMTIKMQTWGPWLLTLWVLQPKCLMSLPPQHPQRASCRGSTQGVYLPSMPEITVPGAPPPKSSRNTCSSNQEPSTRRHLGPKGTGRVLHPTYPGYHSVLVQQGLPSQEGRRSGLRCVSMLETCSVECLPTV